MNRPGADRTILCTRCRHTDAPCHPGFELIRRLRAAMDAAGDAVGDRFEVSGTAAVTGCTRACTVAYRGSRGAMFLFGDVDPDADIDALVATARTKGQGWGDAGGGLVEPGSPVCEQAPAAVLVLERTDAVLQ
ncbi:MAG: DUF1636 domain-containing protein [Rhodobacteraceae bacterium]|nr:DUF1636 domain-containing protein [Paracoccaceae bacterium]